MRILGIDPTSTGAMGWAVAMHGAIISCGQSKIPPGLDEVGRLDFQSAAFAFVLDEQRPEAVIIEKPIINSAVVRRYVEQDTPAANIGKITGATRSSIDVGLAAGALLHIARARKLPVVLLNPGTAKHFGTGSVHAKKTTVQEAARARMYEMHYKLAQVERRPGPDFNTIKKPSDHIAAAIFIALAGERDLLMKAQLVAVEGSTP